MNQNLKQKINQKLKEFEKQKNYFSELCFCILTANFQAEKSIQIQKKLSSRFSTLSLSELKHQLKLLGHRFPNKRAEYIFEARQHKSKLSKIIKLPEYEAREWLINNVKGLGMKEASHFLRNLGRKNLAIIDRHILKSLNLNPKNLSKKTYLSIENKLSQRAKQLNLSQAGLDLYLWHSQTGKILK